MSSGLLPTLAAGLLVITSIVILVSRDWRWSIIALGVQYLGVLTLVGTHWPLGMAAAKLVVGWMAGATLGLTQLGIKKQASESSWPSGWVFRLLAAGLVLLIVFSTSSKVSAWLPGVGIAQVQGSLILMGIGLLQLGMTANPFRVVLGLLTFLAGFEILYAAVEVSVLVAGLLAGVNLGLALVGSYLIEFSPAGETS